VKKDVIDWRDGKRGCSEEEVGQRKKAGIAKIVNTKDSGRDQKGCG